MYAQMLVDLARLPVLPEQPPQHPLPPHPQHLARHPRLRRTLSLTGAGVAALSLRREEVARACARVHGGGLDDDAPVLDQLLDVDARVGIADLGLLSGVEPDYALADACDARGEALL